jgi:DNA repair protein SbcC/Rad50
MYLEKMRCNLSVKLEGYKVNKDGSIREKVTPIILRDGEQEGSGSYRKFSGGERAKIDFAMIVALQTLINNNCENSGLDLLWIDEVTESLDGRGLENLIESVRDLGKTILVTSHVTHESHHDNILTIEKVNGKSRIL